MSEKNNNAQLVTASPSLFDRVMASEAARRGISGAVAGVLVGLVSELIWPSDDA